MEDDDDNDDLDSVLAAQNEAAWDELLAAERRRSIEYSEARLEAESILAARRDLAERERALRELAQRIDAPDVIAILDG